jgi:hypothetical protein
MLAITKGIITAIYKSADESNIRTKFDEKQFVNWMA